MRHVESREEYREIIESVARVYMDQIVPGDVVDDKDAADLASAIVASINPSRGPRVQTSATLFGEPVNARQGVELEEPLCPASVLAVTDREDLKKDMYIDDAAYLVVKEDLEKEVPETVEVTEDTATVAFRELEELIEKFEEKDTALLDKDVFRARNELEEKLETTER